MTSLRPPEGRRLLRIEARNTETPIERKPPWIKTRAVMGPEYTELRGLVQREANPRNRRSSRVSLTEAVKAGHAAIRGERGKFYEQWLTDLSDEERVALTAALEKVPRRVIDSAPHMFDL